MFDQPLPICVVPDTSNGVLHISTQLHLENRPLLVTASRKFDDSFDNTLKRICLNLNKRFKLKLDNEKIRSFLITRDGDQESKTDLSTLIVSDIFQEGNLIEIEDVRYIVYVNGPVVEKLDLPRMVLVEHFLIPKVTLKNATEESSMFVWKRKKSRSEDWEETQCRDFAYFVRKDEREHLFKLEIVPSDGTRNGVVAESATSIVPQLCESSFNYLKRAAKLQTLRYGEYRVVSYNLLADFYSKTKEAKEMYSYCDDKFLNFEYRRPVIVNELIAYDASIILVQELEKQTSDALRMILTEYEHIFHIKPNMHEGSGIFVRRDAFTVERDFTIRISDILDKIDQSLVERIRASNEVYSLLVKQPSLLQCVLLRDKQNNLWLVGNVHLCAGETADNVRFFQAFAVLRYMLDLSKQDSSIPQYRILVGGDFNTTPDCALFKLCDSAKSGCPVEPSLWFPEYSQENSTKGHSYHDREFKLEIPFKSGTGFPEVTNLTATFSGCLDYIFYSAHNLVVRDRGEIEPQKSDLTRDVAIPSKDFPSDHAPVMATFCVE